MGVILGSPWWVKMGRPFDVQDAETAFRALRDTVGEAVVHRNGCLLVLFWFILRRQSECFLFILRDSQGSAWLHKGNSALYQP